MLFIQGCLFSNTIAVINKGPVKQIYKPNTLKKTELQYKISKKYIHIRSPHIYDCKKYFFSFDLKMTIDVWERMSLGSSLKQYGP